tara:strand:+ start:117987 stop:120212 length:2226 start_codon:yes stop_codon:yes gene_type:complete
MKEKYNYILFLLSLFSLNIAAQSPGFEWAKSIGGTGDDYSGFVTSDSSGNIYMTGYYTGTVDFDPNSNVENLTSVGNKDIFIQKLDANGNLIWIKSIGGNGYDIAKSITIDASGNIYLTGNFQETVDFNPGPETNTLTSNGDWDFFLLKLDSNGNFIWVNSTGGSSSDDVNSVAIDSSGNVYLTGNFYYTVDFDPGSETFNLTSAGCNDFFIQKFDTDGNYIWAKTIGNNACGSAISLTIDSSDNTYITGYYSGTVDFDPGASTTNLSSSGGSDIFILKLDSNGNFIWAKSFQEISNGTYGYTSKCITTDIWGNIYITGSYSGTVDFDPGEETTSFTTTALSDIFIVKLDTAGNLLWANSMGTDNPSYYSGGASIITDTSGNVYTIGDFQGTIDFDSSSGVNNITTIGDSDAFVQKLDTSGNFIWASSFGGSGTWCRAYSIINDSSNNLYLTGGFAGTVDLNPTANTENHTSAGNRDIFIQKLSQTTQESTIWTSNSDDYTNFTATNSDGDAFTWETENGNIAAKGLITNTSFFSKSYDATAGNLTPDNLLITPTGAINVPSNVSSISFKLNVEASSSERPAEHFAVYVFDEAIGQSFDTKIHEETLTVGGTGSAKDIIASIPTSFAGKTIGIIIRHYNTIGQDKLYVDDFEVNYEASTLSVKEKNNQNLSLYPNPTKDNIHLNTTQESLFVLTNINGQVLINGTLDKGENTINLAEFQNGLYFLNIKSNLGTITKKIIKN